MPDNAAESSEADKPDYPWCGTGAKYWEMIADQLSRDGWSLGCVSFWDERGRKMHCADAHREDGGRFFVHAEEKTTGFLELEAQCRMR